MKLTKLMMAVVVSATMLFVSCKPKDADIQKTVQAKEATGITATVAEGVVTLTGVVESEEAKAKAESDIKDEKGVKSVVNNITVTPPVVVAPPVSMTTTLDAATQQKVKDGLKDMKSVTVEFTADKAVLKGTVTAAQRMTIMQLLASAKVQSDVSGLTEKK